MDYANQRPLQCTSRLVVALASGSTSIMQLVNVTLSLCMYTGGRPRSARVNRQRRKASTAGDFSLLFFRQLRPVCEMLSAYRMRIGPVPPIKRRAPRASCARKTAAQLMLYTYYAFTYTLAKRSRKHTYYFTTWTKFTRACARRRGGLPHTRFRARTNSATPATSAV